MPVTIIVGGQFGSEGKGKVAHYFAKELKASVAVRCGGPNSGHTVIDPNGNPIIFQQLPTAAILPNVSIVLCAGMYIDIDILFKEIAITNLPNDRLFIDPNAVILTPEIKKYERECKLIDTIGSTGSGTGEAIIRRINRNKTIRFAKDEISLSAFVKDTKKILRNQLVNGNRVILEGTQGFGLSLLHSPFYPYVTSRDTSASGFLSEAGLSPLDVDGVVLTIRAFPIRVSGNSGPLANETSWHDLTLEGNHRFPIEEKTSVTHRIRRVAKFDHDIVKKAIDSNNPTTIVLNHIDYIHRIEDNLSDKLFKSFISNVERSIRKRVDYIGLGPNSLCKNDYT